MSAQDASYLIFLNEAGEERTDWGFKDNPVVAMAVGSSTNKVWQWNDWLNLGSIDLMPPWILVYSDHGLRGMHDDCKRKLHELVGDHVRIWHHGGGVNFDITMGKVREKFKDKDKGFIAAGFNENVPLFPFSATTEFPWKSELDTVRDNLFKSKTLDFDEARKNMDDAWNKATAKVVP
jgi:hypothetical protein